MADKNTVARNVIRIEEARHIDPKHIFLVLWTAYLKCASNGARVPCVKPTDSWIVTPMYSVVLFV